MSVTKKNQTWFPDFFWLGPQKSASTWAYHCFLEHPEIYVPGYDENLTGVGGDAIHYFTIHYDKGENWYHQFYNHYNDEKISGDTTPSYLRSERAAQRIAGEVPDAKFIICPRHPVERAYSHFWHEKKKERFQYNFSEILKNYDLFRNWIVPGFYYRQIKHYLQYFNRDQFLILFYEDLVSSNRDFIESVFEFLGVDKNFKPSVLNERINEAGYRQNTAYKGFQSGVGFLEQFQLKRFFEFIKNTPGFDSFKTWAFGLREYESGMKDSTRKKIIEIYRKENHKLAEFTGRDLNHWNQ